MDTQTWINLAVGALLGGGGAAGILATIFGRARDKTQAQAMDNQFVLGGMKDLATELRTQHVEDLAEIAALKKELADERAKK